MRLYPAFVVVVVVEDFFSSHSSFYMLVWRQVAAFPSSTVLNKPRANVLVNVPDLGHYSAQELEMSQIQVSHFFFAFVLVCSDDKNKDVDCTPICDFLWQSMRENHPSFTVAATFEPRNPLAQLTTIATGEQPSVHGVIGSEWVNAKSKGRVFAFDKQEATSHAAVPTIADIVAHSFEGSLVVSVSASAQFAAALAGHPSSADAAVVSVDAEVCV
jgi:hypothetical protein